MRSVEHVSIEKSRNRNIFNKFRYTTILEEFIL
jgi:hypothetical protein